MAKPLILFMSCLFFIFCSSAAVLLDRLECLAFEQCLEVGPNNRASLIPSVCRFLNWWHKRLCMAPRCLVVKYDPEKFVFTQLEGLILLNETVANDILARGIVKSKSKFYNFLDYIFYKEVESEAEVGD